MRKWLILFVFITTLAQAELGSGDYLAQPPRIVTTEIWHYNQLTPVYQIDIEHAGNDAVLTAAEAAVASVRPEFKKFTEQFAQAVDHYVIGRQETGTRTTIYIRRSIIADWLITS